MVKSSDTTVDHGLNSEDLAGLHLAGGLGSSVVHWVRSAVELDAARKSVSYERFLTIRAAARNALAD